MIFWRVDTPFSGFELAAGLSFYPGGGNERLRRPFRFMMKKIITYGTFDLLHLGHVNLLRRARALGDHLIVGLSTDEFNLQKHKEAFYPFEHRKLILEALRYVDQVIIEHSWEQKVDDIQTLGVDTFVMGSDWTGHFDFLKPHCEVVYLPRTTGLSTSRTKSGLNLP